MFLVRLGTVVALLTMPGLAAAQGTKPSDPQIAHIAYTPGQIDIEAAQLALKKSKSKEVRAFASRFLNAFR